MGERSPLPSDPTFVGATAMGRRINAIKGKANFACGNSESSRVVCCILCGIVTLMQVIKHKHDLVNAHQCIYSHCIQTCFKLTMYPNEKFSVLLSQGGHKRMLH